jgi:6-phosphogluconolactonase/glucosamine-6-phosphate isomerase/deaminase
MFSMRHIVTDSIQDACQQTIVTLEQSVSRGSIVFLAGGNSPRPIYEQLTERMLYGPIGYAMIDERFGEWGHARSNERMIIQSGLERAIRQDGARWYGVLAREQSETLTDCATRYDQTVRDLIYQFPSHVALIGVGTDGHIAGIPAGVYSQTVFDRMFSTSTLCTAYDEAPYGARVTMTLTALSLMDHIVVMAWGKEKANARKLMLQEGNICDLPARWLYESTIHEKVTIIE